MKSTYLLILFVTLLTLGCKKNNTTAVVDDTQAKTATTTHTKDNADLPGWAKNANIYEVNLRQYTAEGTFNAFAKHLPRLKEMGVDILWFMPLFPISVEKRKGTLGSYYAVSDFKAVNPEHGTMANFEALIAQIHALDMHLILDWVPNHTGWDHPWLKEHKDWYTQDSLGNVTDPLDPSTGESWGWTDVADLNYDNKAMRLEMISDMAFWITEKGIDGYRMDVAHNVPDDFWAEVKSHLFGLGQDLFMLAEAEDPSHRNTGAFHTSYGWTMHHVLNDVAKGKKTALDILKALEVDKTKFSKGFHMHFTTNHDENTWNGTVMERMGAAHLTLAALTFTLEGMPLIYSGQEEALDRRLEFFEKDDIQFKDYAYAPFYKKLLALKHNNQALWNGEHGGPLVPMIEDDKVLAFSREKNGDVVTAVFNLTDKRTSFTIPKAIKGKDIMTGQSVNWKAETALGLEPWQYYVLSSK